MKKLLVACMLTAAVIPSIALAENPDLSITAGSISFSTSKLYAGDSVRIYASVRNVGDVDVTGYIFFYQGSMPIGRSQTISLRADGAPDEVFVDFTVPQGSFNIRAIIQGTSPQDVNPSNDVAVTPLYHPLVDEDRDGVEDETDNCPSQENSDQLDTDEDDIGDVCDDDWDNDSVTNAQDFAPNDPSVTQDDSQPEPAPVSAFEAPPAVQPVAPSTSTAADPTSASSIAPIDEPEAENSAPAMIATTTNIVSKLKISPNARFTYRQVDWRTYEFTLAHQSDEGVEFVWDFGDGASSVQPQITHSFAGSGAYVVTLNTMDQNGSRASDAQSFDISFFHLSNPLVQIILGTLFIVLAALCVVMYKVHLRIVELTHKHEGSSV